MRRIALEACGYGDQSKMQYMDQEQPCQSIIGDHCNQVIDGCDQRTGSDGGVNSELFEENWNGSAGNAGIPEKGAAAQ